MRAYNELYLTDASECLATMIDCGVNAYGICGEALMEYFIASGLAREFERGNPSIVAGMSGMELAREVVALACPRDSLESKSNWIPTPQKSAEYWAGWIIAQYQWNTGQSFARVFERLSFEDLLCMYPLFHEMDASQAIEAIEQHMREHPQPTRLKQLRIACGLTQEELSARAEVGLRSIQMYEQRVNDINKAQGRFLARLARALHCEIADLLEDETA